MATFVLIPGAGSDAWSWHLVVPLLEAAGHTAVPVELPEHADTLAECADAVADAARERARGDLIAVGHSLGGFTAPLLVGRLPVAMIVLVAAMVPAPGETFGDWWANTGWPGADTDDLRATFFHDVPAEVTDQAWARGERHLSGTAFEKPWPLDAWPDVPTRFLLCRDDRFFPADFQRRVARERLGITADEMDGGHLPALARPGELAERLLAYADQLG